MLDPSRDEARRWAAEELARREYRQAEPGLFTRALEWVVDRIQQLLSSVPDVGNTVWALGTGVLVTAVLAVLAYAIWRAGGVGPLRRAEPQSVFGDEPALSAADHRAAAARAEAMQDWESAVLERFRAVVRTLEERTVLSARAGRTAGEVARESAAALPDLAGELAAGARSFDAIRYGGRAATAEAAGRLRDLDEAVQASRVVTSALTEALTEANAGAPPVGGTPR